MSKFPELYNSKSAVSEKDKFFGYKETTHKIITSLGDKMPKNYLILGGRRIGKTSFLWNIRNFLQNSDSQYPQSCEKVPIYVDFQGCESFTKEKIFEKMLSEINSSLNQQENLTTNRQRNLTVNNKVGMGYFVDRIMEITKKNHNLRIIFLIDEIDVLLNKDWIGELFGNFRYLISASELKRNVSFLFAGLWNSYYLKMSGSPLYNVLQPPIWLKVLPEKDAKDLIIKPTNSKLPENVSNLICKKTGGHPYLIHSIMEKIHEDDPAKVTEEMINIIINDLDIRDELERWYEKIHPVNKTIYYCLSKEKNSINSKIISQKCDIRYSECDKYLKELLSYGMIVEENGNYKIINKIFEDYFREYYYEEFERRFNEKDAAIISSPQILRPTTVAKLDELIQKKDLAIEWRDNNIEMLRKNYGGKWVAYSEQYNERIFDSDNDYDELKKRAENLIGNDDDFEMFYVRENKNKE